MSKCPVRSYLGTPRRKKEKEKLETMERSAAVVESYRLLRQPSKSCVAELMP